MLKNEVHFYSFTKLSCFRGGVKPRFSPNINFLATLVHDVIDIKCIKKFRRLGFLADNISFVQICEEQDSNLFTQIMHNENHVLHQLLPPVRNVPYSLRPRAHNREVPVANATMRKNFNVSFIACCIWTHINYLIVLVITWIIMNCSVLSVNFNLISFLYFDVSPLRLTKGSLKPLLTYLLTYLLT